MATDPATLTHLRRRIAALQGNGVSPGQSRVIPFGLAAVDGLLPAGGLACGCIHEILAGGDGGSATAFAAALAGRAQQRYRPAVAWIAPRRAQRESLYGPGLLPFGLDPAALLVVRIPGSGHTGAARALWAMEEALRSPAVGAVCAEIDALDLTASRRLQLAAEAGGALGLLLRDAARSAAPPIASVTRWRIAAAPSAPAWPAALPGAVRWRVELLRARGGSPHHWLLEWRHDPDHDAAGGFALAAAPGDRPARSAASARPERIIPLAHPWARAG